MKFIPDRDIPDLSGRVIVVTGGGGGLGKQSVLQLSKHNPAKIYLAARSRDKFDAALSQIRESIHNSAVGGGKGSKETASATTAASSEGWSICPIEFLELDLASFASIKAAASHFLARESRLDILLANAGMMGNRGVTPEGFEMTMGVNHLGHALLIRLLLPLMIETAKMSGVSKGDVRVVTLSSEAEGFAPKAYPFEALRGPQLDAWTMTKYAQSKLANVQYTKELVRHFPEDECGVRFVSVHPGRVETEIGREVFSSPLVNTVLKFILSGLMGVVDVEKGARNQLWACTAADGNGKGPVNGEFYFPVGVEGKASKKALDKEMARGLWEWTEGIIGSELEEVKR